MPHNAVLKTINWALLLHLCWTYKTRFALGFFYSTGAALASITALLWCRPAVSAQSRLEADDSSVSLASSRSGLGRPAGLIHTALKHKTTAGAGPGAFCSTPPSASKKGSWSMTNTGRASPGPTPKPKVQPSIHVLCDCVPYPTNLPADAHGLLKCRQPHCFGPCLACLPASNNVLLKIQSEHKLLPPPHPQSPAPPCIGSGPASTLPFLFWPP